MWLGDAEVFPVILINLLPYREEKRRRRKTAFFVGLGIAAAVGAGLVIAAYALLEYLNGEQQRRNQYLSAEIGRLETQIKASARWKICRPTATRPCICSTNWLAMRRKVSI